MSTVESPRKALPAQLKLVLEGMDVQISKVWD